MITFIRVYNIGSQLTFTTTYKSTKHNTSTAVVTQLQEREREQRLETRELPYTQSQRKIRIEQS